MVVVSRLVELVDEEEIVVCVGDITDVPVDEVAVLVVLVALDDTTEDNEDELEDAPALMMTYELINGSPKL